MTAPLQTYDDGSNAPPPVPSDLADALLDLDEVFDAAREEGIAEPSQLAFENARGLLKAMYALSPRRFDVYPMSDGYIAVDGRGGYGRAALLTCGSAGDVVCLVTIDGERRRAHYATTAGLPDDFVRQALRELDDAFPSDCRRSYNRYNCAISRSTREMIAYSDAIPEWDERGLLPPYLGHQADTEDRSPYQVLLADLVERFITTSARCDLLAGFLDFRATLRQAGLTRGFQWVNGSFIEDIMHIEAREPRDIDVITFYHLPNGYTQKDVIRSFPLIVNRVAIKNQYKIDARFLCMDNDDMRYLAGRFAYYNSLLSHRRNWEWKGYLQIDLSDPGDRVARNILNRVANEEATK